MLKMDLEYNNGILFARLKGILNNKSSYKINQYLNPVLKKHKIKYLVYNLFSLESIDESGLNAIINTKITIKNNHGKIVICEVPEVISQAIKSLKLFKLKDEREVLKRIEV